MRNSQQPIASVSAKPWSVPSRDRDICVNISAVMATARLARAYESLRKRYVAQHITRRCRIRQPPDRYRSGVVSAATAGRHAPGRIVDLTTHAIAVLFWLSLSILA